MTRLHNFSAGPAALPEPVLERAKAELLDYEGKGLSVMEMSHRSKEFVGIAERAEADLRELLAVPDDYAVLFLQGGATAQFSAVPLNLTSSADDVAAYVNTGAWSKKAIGEAKRYCEVVVAASSEAENFSLVPPQAEWNVPANARYVHICPNETIGGVEFPFVPDVGEIPLVADFSSTILSRPIDVSRYGVIYAGAQKNIGPAGIAVVIVRRDLMGNARPETPTVLDWQAYADADSMYNTPPTFAWYLSGLVFQWLKDLGGLEAMAEINRRKAETLYGAIDGIQLLRLARREGVPVLDERALHARRSGPRREVPGGGGGRGPAQPQGSPQRRRHAREPLQRRRPGVRGRAGRVHGGLRVPSRLRQGR